MGRAVLPDTNQLHRKIFEMGQRIRQLEDALAILQSSVSTEPHPLLTNQMLPVEPKSSLGSSNSMNELTDTLDGFGTLTIGDSGEAKYFGASAGSEVGDLIQSPHNSSNRLTGFELQTLLSVRTPLRSLAFPAYVLNKLYCRWYLRPLLTSGAQTSIPA